VLNKSITVVIPVLNEASNLLLLLSRLRPVLDRIGYGWEIFFVDDGSTDNTLDIIRQCNAGDKRIKGISLSRNFGQDVALAAGLRYADGEVVIVMDADLQHPPEVLVDFIAKWREGYQVVYGQRIDQQGTRPRLRRLTSRLYYGLFDALTDSPLLHAAGMGDYWLLDRRALEAFNGMGEVTRFTKGLCSWIGFRSVGVPYHVAERRTGSSRWSYRRLVRQALNGLTSFSTLPLRVWSLVGVAISLAAIAYSIVVLVETLVLGRDSPGYPTIIIAIMFLGGTQLISLGVVGEYLGRVYEEVKHRPLFIVAEEIGLQGHRLELPSNLPIHAERRAGERN
jgi:polyisoprenyl-phosphate glycosyltransferase